MTGIAISSSRIDWTFNPPANSENATLRYQVAIRLTSDTAFPASTLIDVASYSATGLTADTGYFIKIAAVDASGTAVQPAVFGPFYTRANDTAFPNGSESADGTIVSTTPGSIVNSTGETFTLTGTAGSYQVAVDSTADTSRTGVLSLQYWARKVWLVDATSSPTRFFGKNQGSSPWVEYTSIANGAGQPVPVATVIPLTRGTPPGAMAPITPDLTLDSVGTSYIQVTSAGALSGTGPFRHVWRIKKIADVVIDELQFRKTSASVFGELRYCDDGSPVWRFTGLDPNTAYVIQGASVDVWGQQGDWTDASLIISTLAAPAELDDAPDGFEYFHFGVGSDGVGYYDNASQTFGHAYQEILVKHYDSTDSSHIYYDKNGFGLDPNVGPVVSQTVVDSIEPILEDLQKIFGYVLPLNFGGTVTADNTDGLKINVVIRRDQPYYGFHTPPWSQDYILALPPALDTAGTYGSVLAYRMAQSFGSGIHALLGGDAFAFSAALSEAISGALYPANERFWVAAFYWSWSGKSIAEEAPDFVNFDVAKSSREFFRALGCNILFISWLRHLGHSFRAILEAANGLDWPCNGKQIYASLTGSQADPFPLFLADFRTLFPLIHPGQVAGGDTITYDPWATAVGELSAPPAAILTGTVHPEGTGTKSLVLSVAGVPSPGLDGATLPLFTVMVDDVVIGTGLSAAARYTACEYADFAFAITLDDGAHTVVVSLDNWEDPLRVDPTLGGFKRPGRSLHILEVTYQDTATGQTAHLYRNNTASFTIG